MGLKIKKRTGQVGWSLRKMDDSYIIRDDWPAGLRADMTVEEARAYIKTLNAQSRVIEQEVRRLAGRARIRSKEETACAWLPEELTTAYEQTFLSEHSTAKHWAIWAHVRAAVIAINRPPKRWAVNPIPIYNWLLKKRFSLGHACRVLSALNKYGYLFALEYDTPFRDVDRPTQEWVARFEDRQEERRRSLPVSEEQLREAAEKLTKEEAAWCVAAWCFGLRPHEADQLLDPPGTTWEWIQVGADDALRIYQPKLRGVRETQRFKTIPVWSPQQAGAKLLIDARRLKRPSTRRAREVLPAGCSLYGLRHGFARYMQEHRIDLETLSSWLGHKNLETTQRYYQDHNLPAPAPKPAATAHTQKKNRS